MPESLSLTVAAAGVVTLVVLGVLFIGFRLLRGGRDLATDAERATFTTLHLASLAGKHLRNGLEPAGAGKAARHLRTLLGAEALALTDAHSVVAWAGASSEGVGVATGSIATIDASVPGLDSAAREHPHVEVMRLAAEVFASGQTRVLRAERGTAGAVGGRHGTAALDAVVAPIRAGTRILGVVAAFTPRARPGLVRATNEVADWVAAQVELAELDRSRRLLVEAEVRALRAQISPHFIYNSLNAIASFINTDPARARELVLEFADYTRYSFRRHGDFTTIAEELGSIHRYLTLEQARFGERLRVSLQIAPEVLSTVIPFLSLQPLVENSVRHGLEGTEQGGQISILGRDLGAVAEITIEDDGVGIDPERLRTVLAGQNDGEHVGLRNVDQRLRQVYGDEFGLVIETAVGAGTLITMRVPKSQPGHDAASRAGDARLGR
ncbi:sensor histidine kinase [Microterricola pindariensis]|uniref:Sensor histidine kinase n=1 Tax=Microterricola pindariensis TaxID=478010 RepID=A0ABX5AVQ5_9MICO|nr:histidine kinase [Microterricola pindariensis]PPL17797.1 sensor histidine kinase [Microterricola pindariensis]